jgi:hypothetical protein
MLGLAEQTTLWALREKLPTKSGNLMFLVTPKHLPIVRNTLVTSLPEGSRYEGGFWHLPDGDKVFLRTFQDKVPENLSEYDLVVCTGGENIPPEQWAPLKSWRIRDALS